MNEAKIKQLLVRFQTLIALLLMIILLSFLSDKFMTTDNIWNVMRQISVNVCISVGMTLVILTGGIDLSVGSILAFSGVITAGLLKHGIELESLNTFVGFTMFGGLTAGIIVGSILGYVNGFVITRFNVPPFIATLAMLTMARGRTMLYTGGFPITGLGESFAYIGTGWFIRIPMPVWISAVIVVLAIILAGKTRTGRYIYAIGGNERASRLSGLNIRKIKIIVYTLAGEV